MLQSTDPESPGNKEGPRDILKSPWKREIKKEILWVNGGQVGTVAWGV